MPLLRPSSQKFALLAGMVAFSAPLAAEATFTRVDAVKAEWARKPPVLPAETLAALSPADRARLELTLKRIGAPGAPALLPPWLETPTEALWLAKAREARTPEDRFTALFFLNRLKSTQALTALDGLTAKDANTWPVFYHLEAQVARARLNGCVFPDAIQIFLEALRLNGKIDPSRNNAARLSLILAGLIKGDAKFPDGLDLGCLDAWNRGPWAIRAKEHLDLLKTALAMPGNPGPAARLLEGLPPQPVPEALPLAMLALRSQSIPWRVAALEYLAKLPTLDEATLTEVKAAAFRNYAGPLCPGFVAVLRKHAPLEALRYDRFLLTNDDPVGGAAALEDLPEAPANLEALVKQVWKASQYDVVQALLPALERWKLPVDQRKALLTRFLGHPCWTARLDAYNLLVKLDAATPWPSAPKDSFLEEAILAEACRLARTDKPLRMRITFDRFRKIVIRLDPVNAPINVANLTLLARRGYFDNHLVPRVVPDFVVQMGSPIDTMDGGPGYTVRCEDSLLPYGPGSVGMALSGKDTGGSQFFITTNATPHLTGRYTRIGTVEDLDTAMTILDSLELGAKILKVEVF